MTTSSVSVALKRYRWFFLLAAVYDMALGLLFIVAYKPMFEWLGMTLPPHVAYIHLLAIFVFVQGASYLIAWTGPLANVGIVKVGVLYKAGYSGLAAYYLVTAQIPAMFFAWFGLFDFLFLIGFVSFLRWAGRGAPSA